MYDGAIRIHRHDVSAFDQNRVHSEVSRAARIMRGYCRDCKGGLESVPGAVATGYHWRPNLDRGSNSDPVVTAPRTDLIS
jgi:hypothetical protein